MKQVSKIVAIAASAILLDQLSKFFFIKNPNFWNTGEFFGLFLNYNDGIAFGLDLPQVLIFIGIAVVLSYGAYYAFKNFRIEKFLTQLTLGLILGGAIGNLIDRLRIGQVVDFIKVGSWPMFNLADSAICIGATIIVLWHKRIVK